MISAKAYVPSDVLTASNGKTIEVYNTDAEGRLTLADALVYADKTVGCEKIIELSTLTGACIAALGRQIAGVFTESDELAEELDLISKTTGEKAWRMPMEHEYKEQIESIIADLKNCGTKYGGAITAALFLQNFVDPQKPFAHIDLAGEFIETNVEPYLLYRGDAHRSVSHNTHTIGPVWNEKKGATGFGVKLVTEWVCRQGQD
jgi:leucyl aminopeptidase